MQRVTEQALDLVVPAEGVLVGLNDGARITYICGAGYLSGPVGTTTDLHSSIGGLCVRCAEVLRCDDTETDPRVDIEVCRRVGTRSTVCVPLIRGSEVFGVLAVGSPQPAAFGETDVLYLQGMAELLGVAAGIAADLARFGEMLTAPGVAVPTSAAADRFLMGVLNPEAARLVEARQRVQSVLDDPSLLTMEFQPILDLATDRLIAVEALSRFGPEPIRPPDAWFHEGHETGLGVELEMLAVRRALASFPDLPDDAVMTINAGPETTLSDELFEAVLTSGCADRVVVELTEHAEVLDYRSLMARLSELRHLGVRLAVDDTGSGFSSLSHILKLAPDFIKLDRELIMGIDVDPVRRSLASALVAFAAESGAEVLAEGIETRDELDVVRALGVRFGQGYFIGRPAPLRLTTAA
jgi:EAL domain-containing protein (putative c-di-GMP-specific phosphodiesterase class I)